MARYTGPKDKLSRREGTDLFGKGPKLTRLNVPPGQHGPKGFRRISEYGKQLREKQKTKRIYGVLEKQFKRYVNQATAAKTNTEDALVQILESRLDNVVYRLGFAPTRVAARQYVNHGHIMVNGKKVDIPSYHVKPGDTITLSSKLMKIPDVKQLLKEKVKLPEWLKRKAAVGKVEDLPTSQDLPEPISLKEIIKFYSR